MNKSLENYLVKSSLFKQEQSKVYPHYSSIQHYDSRSENETIFKSHIKNRGSTAKRERPSYFSRSYMQQGQRVQPTYQHCEICKSRSKSRSKSKRVDNSRLEQQNSQYEISQLLSSRAQTQKKSGVIRSVNVEEQLEPESEERLFVVNNNNEVKMTNFSLPPYSNYQPRTYTFKPEASQTPPLKKTHSNQDKFAQTQERVMINLGTQIKIQQAVPQKVEKLKKSRVEQLNSSFKQLKTISVQISPEVSRQKLHQSHSQLSEEQRKLFFNSTRHQTTKYLQNINLQLRQAYRQLQKVQKQIDGVIEIQLQQVCQKLQHNLYQIIEVQLQEFRLNERRNFYQNRVAYMAELYQIKTNIGYRLQAIDSYKLKLRDEYEWREVIGNLLTPDYQSNIEFIIKKAKQVKNHSPTNAKIFLSSYSKTMIETVHQPLQKQIAFAIQSLFCNFSSFWKKMIQRMYKNKKEYSETTYSYQNGQPNIEISPT